MKQSMRIHSQTVQEEGGKGKGAGTEAPTPSLDL
jgi:hypothetical protein